MGGVEAMMNVYAGRGRVARGGLEVETGGEIVVMNGDHSAAYRSRALNS